MNKVKRLYTKGEVTNRVDRSIKLLEILFDDRTLSEELRIMNQTRAGIEEDPEGGIHPIRDACDYDDGDWNENGDL